jgi:membrane protein implicated in regulation of membrane protease activity
MAIWVWLLGAGVLAIVETMTANLLFASLAVSAAAAMVTAWAGGGFLAQGVAFAISSIVTLAVLRPLALREIARRTPHTATNTDALIGASAKTRSAVTEDSGEIDLRGEVWSAKSTGGTIAKGHRVTVSSIDGATAIVTQEAAS